MSMGIRCSANTALSATAISAITTVTGRLSASNTNCILSYLCLRSCFINERLNIAGGDRNAQQAAPYAQSRKGVVNFRLCQESLGISHVDDVPKTRLIARRCLLNCCVCRGNLDRSVFCYFTRTFENR